ncbi:hypothetical protein BGZ72_008062 [Mortierella alpina]|nr:hypothetical protein BGZ72_008062 [Mortierella alpina]
MADKKSSQHHYNLRDSTASGAHHYDFRDNTVAATMSSEAHQPAHQSKTSNRQSAHASATSHTGPSSSKSHQNQGHGHLHSTSATKEHPAVHLATGAEENLEHPVQLEHEHEGHHAK